MGYAIPGFAVRNKVIILITFRITINVVCNARAAGNLLLQFILLTDHHARMGGGAYRSADLGIFVVLLT